jgi:glycosyltransferase involved in cell wall biosynthesis
VDHALFRPMDQSSARESLGIAPNGLVLLYVGAMDEYHDLGPVIDALAHSPSPVEFHVVGEGEYRPRYEARAKLAGLGCRFHGHVPHALVPQYIAAADLCIAPYRTEAFHRRLVTFSTLKIPEYMACARPVVSVPSASIRKIVEDGVSGFLFPNDETSWASFFHGLPPREQLARMGTAAARSVESITWDRTAIQYFEACERLISFDASYHAAHIADRAGLAR